MAPPEHPFPVSDLERRVHYHTVNLKEKSRKLGDFDLKRDCELLELVQYSCTTLEQQYERALSNPQGAPRMECFPFVRLFRKCEKNGKVFHVETTAWEGPHAWKPPADSGPVAGAINKRDEESKTESSANLFENYGNLFWSQK
ncbi:uncharacterized protein Z518_09758 [Rhinocladiella mackenziei CBS 650.93]|uniref:Uncharacterized protein n=1 Tax=Rhinocladiella mackenziei CBS 650.93 TaxID=1442369 RepID=A0A0D2GQV5_9EURO|nr:uncharacterized protein Z518_09758 [Rhinocladiella mackenziei CBS 650.93]KIX00693.1 hypothetical protein Z518_09758 [Rhinocladiella mackenziei CBS 650.93]